MNGRTPTKAEKLYISACVQIVGCIPCILDGREIENPAAWTEFHHDPDYGSNEPGCHFRGLRRQITELKAALETERSDVRDISAAWAKNEKELELRRAADKNCFMYGIVDPDGNAHIDELCVSLDRGIIETEVDALNNDTGTDGYRVVSLKTNPADSCTLPPFTEALEQILGRPNFMCSEIAGILRMSGLEIKRKSECEQAAVIYWMLGIYLEHGASWWSVARDNLAAVIEAHNV